MNNNQNNSEYLISAINQGDYENVKGLLEREVNPNEPVLRDCGHYIEKDYPIINAVKNGNIDIIKLLVKNDADVNVSTVGDGCTPLHAAFFIDSSYPQKMPKSKREAQIFSVLQFLLENGANIDLQGGFCVTPLILATDLGNFEILEYLIQKGADINLDLDNNCIDWNESRNTALGTAVQNNNLNVLIFLLNNGANPNPRGCEITPLEEALALKNDEIFNALKKAISEKK